MLRDQVTIVGMLSPMQKPITWFRNTRRRNKIFIIIAILVVSFFIWRNIQSANAKPQYLTQPVQRKTVAQIVSETGNIDTGGRVDVYSSSTGIIEQIYTEDGASVTVGQNLFQVRSTATQQDKVSAYADYESAAASLRQAENTLRDKKAILEKVLDDLNDNDSETFEQKQRRTTAEVAGDNAFDAVKSARAQLNSAALTYQATQTIIVKAPSAGMVANLSFKVGDKVSAGGVTSATPILAITNRIDYTVKLALNEVDIPKVRIGQSAQFTLDAFPDKKFTGRVTHVDSLGTNTAGVITYNIVVAITNPEDSIRPGMTANIDIEVDKAENVLTVPNSAIKPYKGKKAVQIIDPKTKTATYIPVEIGIKSPERTQIKSGISEGVQVITGTKNGAATSGGGPFGR